VKAFFDTDVLIWHLRGDSRALDFLKAMSQKSGIEWWMSAINRAEIVFFMRPEEKEKTMLFLTRFQTRPVDAAIIDTAAGFFKKWNPSHGMDINDAILAATVETCGGVLYTLNEKHYPVPSIVVEKAW
jgi:predicted nucleic acid-binding protein